MRWEGRAEGEQFKAILKEHIELYEQEHGMAPKVVLVCCPSRLFGCMDPDWFELMMEIPEGHHSTVKNGLPFLL